MKPNPSSKPVEENKTYFERLKLIKQGLLPKEAVKKERKAIPKISKKKAQEIADEKAAGDDSLDKWFEERRLEMTGKCSLCPNKSYKNNDERYRWSCHHLLDKRKTMFPSLALHPLNFLEVCHDCHQNIHNKTITWELLHDSAEWSIIVEKFKKIYPFIDEREKKNIPELLLQTFK